MKPQVRKFAERLISFGATDGKSSASTPPTRFAVIDKLRPTLVQVVGTLGFSAVLSRALAKAKTDVAWLRAVHVEPDGDWREWDALETTVGASELFEGRVVLLAEFAGLLVDLIGERLVLQLVHQALPEVTPDELHFGKGSEREKS